MLLPPRQQGHLHTYLLQVTTTQIQPTATAGSCRLSQQLARPNNTGGTTLSTFPDQNALDEGKAPTSPPTHG